MAIRVPTELRVGPPGRRITVGEETRHLMGSIEGPWWFKYSWWVIPLGLILIVGPWFLILGGERNTSPAQVSAPAPTSTTISQPASIPATSSVSPQVTVNIPRIQVDATVRNVIPPAPKVPVPANRELTPEEKANQFWDRVLKRDP